jgi:hypothetical protein
MRPRTFKGPIRWDAWNDIQKGHRKEISNVGRYENLSTTMQFIIRMQYYVQ